MQKVAESKDYKKNIKVEVEDVEESSNEDDYEDEFEDDYDEMEQSFKEAKLEFAKDEKSSKESEDKEELIVRYLSSYKQKYQDANHRKKLVGIINNILYKKIVSNYKTLLDDDLDNEKIDQVIYTTASLLEVSINEIMKM